LRCTLDNCLRRIKRPFPNKYRELAQDSASDIGEQRVAPIDRVPERLLARWEVTWAVGEHAQLVLHAFQQHLRRKQPYSPSR
jgi:hypothetical protein